MNQTAIDFPTQSPINKVRLGGQNKKLLEYLLTGKSINVFSQAKRELKISYLNSRVSELRNKFNIHIIGDMALIKDVEGNNTHCVNYIMLFSEIARVKKEFNL